MMDDFEEEPVQDDEEWLATYADMVTPDGILRHPVPVPDIRPSDFLRFKRHYRVVGRERFRAGKAPVSSLPSKKR